MVKHKGGTCTTYQAASCFLVTISVQPQNHYKYMHELNTIFVKDQTRFDTNNYTWYKVLWLSSGQTRLLHMYMYMISRSAMKS